MGSACCRVLPGLGCFRVRALDGNRKPGRQAEPGHEDLLGHASVARAIGRSRAPDLNTIKVVVKSLLEVNCKHQSSWKTGVSLLASADAGTAEASSDPPGAAVAGAASPGAISLPLALTAAAAGAVSELPDGFRCCCICVMSGCWSLDSDREAGRAPTPAPSLRAAAASLRAACFSC